MTSWRIFCGKVDGIILSARLHTVLSKNVKYQMRALRLPSGDYTGSDGEAAKHMLMIHFPHSSGRVLQEPFQEGWNLASKVVSEDKEMGY
jgi:hypothetical protein